MKKERSMDSIFTLTMRLLIITVAAGFILGIVYTITKDPIAAQELKKATESRQIVLPEATEFEQLEVMSKEEGYGIINEVYEGMADGAPVGYTISVTTKAFSPNLKLTIGLALDGKVTGVNIGSHEETPGLGANATNESFTGQYIDSYTPFVVAKTPTGAESEIAALTGATITSKGVSDAVNVAGEYYNEFLAGGV